VTALAERLALGGFDSRYRGRLAGGHLPDAPRATEARELAVLMPTTFMNASGESVRPAVEGLAIEPETDLLVVCDDLDLSFGRLRLRAGGGCGGHRGMESIAAELGSDRFARLRFGVGRPPSGVDVTDYVLSPFDDGEANGLEACVGRAVEAILATLTGDIERAMGRFNRSDESGPGDPLSGDAG